MRKTPISRKELLEKIRDNINTCEDKTLENVANAIFVRQFKIKPDGLSRWPDGQRRSCQTP